MVSITKRYKAAPKITPALRRFIAHRQHLRFEIFHRDSFSCRLCGKTVSDGAKLTVDHVIPKSKGGELVAENLITACELCNFGKDDILLDAPALEVIMGGER